MLSDFCVQFRIELVNFTITIIKLELRSGNFILEFVETLQEVIYSLLDVSHNSSLLQEARRHLQT